MNKIIVLSMLCINFTCALFAGPREMAAKFAAQTTARKIACGYVAGSLACGTVSAIAHPDTTISIQNNSYQLHRIQNFVFGTLLPTFTIVNIAACPPYWAYKKLTTSTEENK